MSKPISPLSPTPNQDNTVKLSCGWNGPNQSSDNQLIVGGVDLIFKDSTNQYNVPIPKNIDPAQNIRFRVKKQDKETSPKFLSVTKTISLCYALRSLHKMQYQI